MHATTRRSNPASTIAQTFISPTHVIGVDLGGTSLRLALADLAGTLLARWSTATEGVEEPQQIVAHILHGVDRMLTEAHLPRPAVRALGIGVPGLTDAKRGVVLATSYLAGWRDVPLKAILEDALGFPVRVENDVNVATLAEASVGAAVAVPDFVFLAVGTGIGAGIVLRNELHRGSGWLAGEIGYMLVPGVSEVPAAADAPGALESLAGGHGIRATWKGITLSAATRLPQHLNATEIFDLAGTGQPLALDLLRRTARLLAAAVYNIVLILDIPLVVFGGSVGVHPALVAAIRAELADRLGEKAPRLVASALGSDAQLLGAIRLALATRTDR